MSVTRAPPLLFPAASRHTATVIFMHGLGDSGHGWAEVVGNWRRRQRLDQVKFILPHAPSISITVNGGLSMPGWYDIKSFAASVDGLRANEDEAGILVSRDYIQGLVQAELDAGIAPERIVLGGFSQGGAMGIYTGLMAPVRLAGIVALSAYLVLSRKFAGLDRPEASKQTPIFMAHGDADPLVQPVLGQVSHDILRGLGYNVTRKVYPGMAHEACLQEIDDVEAFLRERLPPMDEQPEQPEQPAERPEL